MSGTNTGTSNPIRLLLILCIVYFVGVRYQVDYVKEVLIVLLQHRLSLSRYEWYPSPCIRLSDVVRLGEISL